jgi:hypothetical protein
MPDAEATPMQVRYTGPEPVLLMLPPSAEAPWPRESLLVRPGEVFEWPSVPDAPGFEAAPAPKAQKGADA